MRKVVTVKRRITLSSTATRISLMSCRRSSMVRWSRVMLMMRIGRVYVFFPSIDRYLMLTATGHRNEPPRQDWLPRSQEGRCCCGMSPTPNQANASNTLTCTTEERRRRKRTPTPPNQKTRQSPRQGRRRRARKTSQKDQKGARPRNQESRKGRARV